MNLFPLRTVPLASDLPPGVVSDMLRERIGDGPGAPFAGSVAVDGFVVTRVREYRSTPMPLLRGSVEAAPGGGTDIRLRLRPTNTVVAFMAIWFGFLSAVAALIVLAHAHGIGRGLLTLLVPAGLGGFSWYLLLSVFAADARWELDSLMTAVPALRASVPPRSAGPR